jgi:hypothetical protein
MFIVVFPNVPSCHFSLFLTSRNYTSTMLNDIWILRILFMKRWQPNNRLCGWTNSFTSFTTIFLGVLSETLFFTSKILFLEGQAFYWTSSQAELEEIHENEEALEHSVVNGAGIHGLFIFGELTFLYCLTHKGNSVNVEWIIEYGWYLR